MLYFSSLRAKEIVMNKEKPFSEVPLHLSLDQCFRLNICPPQIHMLKPLPPHVMVFGN